MKSIYQKLILCLLFNLCLVACSNNDENDNSNLTDNTENETDNTENDDTIHFPDPNFKAYMVAHFDKNKDGEISVYEATLITVIVCDSYSIKSLEGIQFCTALTSLYCENNQLTTLDVSKNTALVCLFCYNNQLTALDVSKNTALTYLHCYENPIEVLNLGNLNISINFAYRQLGSSTKLKVIGTKITSLIVCENKLQSLDVSECPALTSLICDNNQLTTLDVSKTNLGNSTSPLPLVCSEMPTLQTLYLKTGWEINYINVQRDTHYIPDQTEIRYKD